MKKIKDFYEAWWFLYNHPSFVDNENYQWGFQDCLDIDVQKVDPKTCKIEDDKSRNTKTEIWFECGQFVSSTNIMGKIREHDIRLDCGGDTFEEAIIELANLVKKYYGDYSDENL